ncbi:hypothetical protein NBO_6g0051 [Nosema bombycis CQ1]|uniref:Uncharacterized protein n=1 Tax=Nosema bombycis (strain CQ1 / CVCC 102059) TaxID=578461 RepID=R0MBG5_NOSB1|nr:hypothetical protein NBO_6g0051 [Nosema bombycis CQ1]|eukprot:EOB15299.1 hypothetical protein NBO_6g0051 [Nosema bombycis CQ1]
MSKKISNREHDQLTHKSKPTQTPVKLIEVTQENLNSVLLELKKDESLLKLNLKNIVNFMFKTCHDNSQILAKLKILHTVDKDLDDKDITDAVDLDVIDSIFSIISHLLGYDTTNLKNTVLIMSGEIYPFSRRLSLWYFKNKQLEDKEVDFYLDEIERIVFKTGNINFITEVYENCMEEVDEEDMNDSMEVSEDECEKVEEDNQVPTINLDLNNQIPNLDLKELEDSEEMDRLDKALGIVLKSKAGLSVADKKRIAKCLDVIEVILERNPIERIIHFKRFIGLVDIDDVLFKKVFRVIKMLIKKYPPSHLEDLYAIYAKSLYKYKNISRTIDTMQDFFKGIFKWMDVFKASSKNELLDLNIVDRSKVSKDEFYSFCFNEEVHLWKIQHLLLYFTRKEDNVKILEAFIELVNRIEFSDEKLSVIESINNRIKVLQ